LIVGHGDEQPRIASLLGDRVTMPGNVGQAELAKLYANADLFLFPSTTEVCPNVVIEAKASGLPVIVAASHGGAQFIRQPGQDGLIAVDQQPASWAAIARPLIADADRRAAISRAARNWAESDWPSWTDVLRNDLLAGWQVAADAASHASSAARRPAISGNRVKIGWSENGVR
jgi:glycosyltransferase involved in cell wall biosynthesis